jgi:hypothetical protein
MLTQLFSSIIVSQADHPFQAVGLDAMLYSSVIKHPLQA